jgi:hypothetical protein
MGHMIQIFRADLYILDGETDDGDPLYLHADYDTRVAETPPMASEWMATWDNGHGPEFAAEYRCIVKDAVGRVLSTAECDNRLAATA